MKSNKPNIQNKLKSYSALAGTIAASIASADAQVVYTDVIPDTTVSNGGFYNLDLNNDAVADFQILQKSGLYYGYFSYDVVGVYALGANNAVDTAGGQGTAAAFIAGEVVDASLNWVDSTQMAAITPPTANALAAQVPAFAIYAGNFMGQNGKFLPLRFDFGGGRYYGWVRLNVAGDAKSFTVIDYAYTNVLNSYSITGALVGISEAALDHKVTIFAYNNTVTVQLDKLVAAEGTILITDISGRTISETTITNTEMNIPMNEAKTGVYMVTVKQSSGSYTKRIYVK
jgi:hypothetical protein